MINNIFMHNLELFFLNHELTMLIVVMDLELGTAAFLHPGPKTESAKFHEILTSVCGGSKTFYNPPPPIVSVHTHMLIFHGICHFVFRPPLTHTH